MHEFHRTVSVVLAKHAAATIVSLNVDVAVAAADGDNAVADFGEDVVVHAAVAVAAAAAAAGGASAAFAATAAAAVVPDVASLTAFVDERTEDHWGAPPLTIPRKVFVYKHQLLMPLIRDCRTAVSPRRLDVV